MSSKAEVWTDDENSSGWKRKLECNETHKRERGVDGVHVEIHKYLFSCNCGSKLSGRRKHRRREHKAFKWSETLGVQMEPIHICRRVHFLKDWSPNEDQPNIKKCRFPFRFKKFEAQRPLLNTGFDKYHDNTSITPIKKTWRDDLSLNSSRHDIFIQQLTWL